MPACHVRARHFRADVGLLVQGLSIGWEFGLRPLEELARVGLLLEHSVYEPASLRRRPDGVGFVLRNPPLRMGAFRGLELLWDGRRVPASEAWIRPGGRGPRRPFDSVGAEAPVGIPVGERTEVGFVGPPPSPGPHSVRLELRSLAVPPLVWMFFKDHVRDGGA